MASAAPPTTRFLSFGAKGQPIPVGDSVVYAVEDVKSVSWGQVFITTVVT